MDCDDCCDDCPPPIPPVKQEDLTERWHVLNNIEYAYSKRNPNVYDALLSEEFAFFFDEGDVGGEIPAQWNRIEEFSATAGLFTSNAQTEPPADPVCKQIKLDLVFDKDNLGWVDTLPEDFPDQTWYTTTVNYTFTFQMDGDLTYIQNNAKAQFTIRNTGTVDAPHWELTEFRDLGQSSVTSNTSEVSQTSTWGQIKSLYD